jgi:hypothetical protein
MGYGKRRRVIVLGNCVADRLRLLLAAYPGFDGSFVMTPAPMIHTLRGPEEWRALADAALACDLVLTQPLFNFGPCNTAALREALGSERLIVFSSPDFEAYFPDAIVLRGKENPRFAPILDWDSSIIFSCFCKGVSIFDVEALYRDHPLFHPAAVDKTIAAALERYLRREEGLDIATTGHVVRNYARAKLFHSPKHPVDDFLVMMLRDLAAALGLDAGAPVPDVDGFGFNQWPVITSRHRRFAFPEQAYFMLAGKKCGLEDAAMAYYNFYEFHPRVVEANQDRIIAVEG